MEIGGIDRTAAGVTNLSDRCVEKAATKTDGGTIIKNNRDSSILREPVQV